MNVKQLNALIVEAVRSRITDDLIERIVAKTFATRPLLVDLKTAMRLLSIGRDKVRREFKPVVVSAGKKKNGQVRGAQYRYKLRDLEQWIERRSLR